ncbi:Fic family protein [Halosimplex pelagicum]|uniref:Fic family protein n=1 Tax=Halosimplex pelagicum TaxID=869886 RepID=A0A7D5PAX0_9EURY|nr:Fic family protein [Halosimplex pelagicum]QLH81318.1 Fic family protein [Halosimplex pelagicum]
MKDGYLIDSPAPGKYLSTDSSASLPASKFYLPDDLPPSIDLSPAVIEANGRAMHSLGRLDGFWSEIDDPDTAFGLFVYKEAEQSSQVEGTQVTVSDMLRSGSDSKDVREARNYAEALRSATNTLAREGRSRENLSLTLVKSLHESLMESGRADDNPRPGEFRTGYVWIEEDNESGFGKSIRFVPPKASAARSKMGNFEEYMQSGGEYPDLVDIGMLHYQLETVHPFADGNGRVGRLLIVLMLIASDILVHPLFYLSSYIRRNRDEYTDLLLAVNEEGDWNAWLEFFLNGIREQADEAFSRAKLLLRLRTAYRDRYSDAPPSVRALVDAIFVEPIFTVSRAAELIEMSNPAANNAVNRLEADGLLEEQTGQERYREFQATEVLEVLNRDVEEIPSPGELIAE